MATEEIEFNGAELVRRMERLAKHAAGDVILTMRTARLSLPKPEKPIRPREIASIRKKLGVSQGVFASLLNVPKPTALSWESGARKPSGAALKLLRIAQRHPEVLAA
jgi:putative transcriptional regulator